MDSIRVWERKTGLSIRILKEPGVASCTSPANSSIFLVLLPHTPSLPISSHFLSLMVRLWILTASQISDNKGYIKTFSVSTGKNLLRVKALATILCMQFDNLGQYLFAGDDKVRFPLLFPPFSLC